MFKKIAIHLVLAKWKRNVDALLTQLVLNIIDYFRRQIFPIAIALILKSPALSSPESLLVVSVSVSGAVSGVMSGVESVVSESGVESVVSESGESVSRCLCLSQGVESVVSESGVESVVSESGVEYVVSESGVESCVSQGRIGSYSRVVSALLDL